MPLGGRTGEESRPRPVAIADLHGVAHVAASGNGTCVLDGRSGVTCWDEFRSGYWELPTPRIPAGAPAAVDVTVGDSFACVLRDDGDVACWGDNRFGQLGSTLPAFKDTQMCRPEPCTAEFWRTPASTGEATLVGWQAPLR